MKECKDRQSQIRDRKVQTQGGFTLVEVMLVVIIIGILATVVMVRFGGNALTAKVNATRTSIKNVCTAVELYEMSVGKMPNSLADLTASIGDDPPLIKNGIPKDSWGSDFQYTKKGEKDYEVRSLGPDQQSGTGDDIWQ